MPDQRFRRTFLVLLVVGVSAAFFAMIRPFLLTILLAAVFSGVSYPLYQWLLVRMGRRPVAAALATLLILVSLVVTPVIGVVVAGAGEALQLSETLGPRLQQVLAEPSELERWLRAIPGYEHVAPYRAEIVAKLGELAGNLSTFVFTALSATTVATASFLFHFVVLLYTMFFFLIGGPRLLHGVLAYLPFADTDKEQMLQQFVSVTRATLKGTILIGVAQGLLGGLAFRVAGIDGAIFWGTIMTVLSIVPGIGGALVWVPAALILVATGDVFRGVGLALFCALVVGSVDNLLRPRLVGRDVQMHELMIFFATLGGIAFFGVMGFIVGPILAALFLTVWKIFGTAFHDAIVVPEDRQV